MCNAKKLLRKLEAERPRVLTASTRALAESIAKSKKRSRKFLQQAGIIDEQGKLTEHYR